MRCVLAPIDARHSIRYQQNAVIVLLVQLQFFFFFEKLVIASGRRSCEMRTVEYVMSVEMAIKISKKQSPQFWIL